MKKRTGNIWRGKNTLPQKNPLIYVVKIFSFIGRPLFILIIVLLKVIDFLVSAVKITFKKTLEIRNKIRFPKYSIPKINIVLLKISSPKIVFPKIRIQFKLNFYLKLISLLIIFGGSYFAGRYFFINIFKDLPEPNKIELKNQSQTTKIYDRNGILLYKIYRQKNQTAISLIELPLFVKQAVIAIEDKDFYNHPGFSLKGIFRAVYQNVFKNKKSGGSTITQQLIKNTLLSPEKTWRRKIKELVLSLMVEKRYSKNQILEMYLNVVGFGGSAYGIEEASQQYFNKSAKDLNLAEAALLAGLPASPTKYSPFGSNPLAAKERQFLVLQRMFEDGYVSETEKITAENFLVKFTPQQIDIKAPHFVMYVKELLVQKYGEEIVEKGGLEVYTSLDLSIQENVQKIVKDEIQKLGNLKITNGAVLVTNPKTGEILAMVGSKDYFAKDIDGNVNVTISERQPGSSIKPITYSIALENGFTPATLLDDSPITYQIPGQSPYSPQNYDRSFHGKVPLRIALGSSYNVPAVKILASFGVQKMIERGKEMGITSWNNSSNYGLSLTLGGGEVKMIDLAAVYGTIANNGKKINLNPILFIKDSRSKIIEETIFEEGKQVIKPETAFLLSYILSDNSSRTPAFGANSLLNIRDREVAVKTGTTQNLRDNWTIGYTPSFLTAVWVGNNNGSSMSYVASGITGASPIWRKVMDVILKNTDKESFNIPGNVIQIPICQTTASLPCQNCPVIRNEYFIIGTEPKTHCNFQNIPITPTPNEK